MATAEFSKFGGILSAALSQHHLSGFGIAQLEFYHLHSNISPLFYFPGGEMYLLTCKSIIKFQMIGKKKTGMKEISTKGNTIITITILQTNNN